MITFIYERMKYVKKALLVGIDDYVQCPLHGCCNDAQAVAEVLEKNEDGSPNFSIRKEENVQTKGQLRGLICECFSGDADIALFYYSGHGYIDAIGGYLVTPDFSDHDYGVSLSDILNIANGSSCKNKIIILDSCHSGFMGAINTNGQNTAVIKEGVTILTASRSNEYAMEVDGNGVFTTLLLEALSGAAADIAGNITPGGVYSYIDKALGAWDQRPVFKTNITQFTSLRKVKPQVDSSIIRKLCNYFEEEDSELPLDPSYEKTNSPDYPYKVIEPYADKYRIAVFSDLQQLEGIGLVIPVGEQHMYFAAMNSKSCRLTPIGKQYWRLVKKGLF